MLLQTHFGTKPTERNSLIIFDKVQMFPQAKAAIKYLVADAFDWKDAGLSKVNYKQFINYQHSLLTSANFGCIT